MVQITLDNIVPPDVPADGWIVQYRIKGTVDTYTTPPGSPFTSFPIVFSTVDPAGTLYEGIIRCDCGDLESTDYAWETPCDCTEFGYVPSPGGNVCQTEETEAPTVTNPGYCLAASTNAVYSTFKSRIYNAGFVLTDLQDFPDSGAVYASMSTGTYWANPGSLPTDGPLNREGVWIDSDCDNIKDALGVGVEVTIAALYNNVGASKTIYIGVAGDNAFKVVVNGSTVVDFPAGGDTQFKIWHIIPVVVPTGTSIINVIGVGDGSVNDAVAMVIYDNTPAEIQAATSDGDLSIIFQSSSLRGTSYDIATCNAGWTLDTSDGPGNYICRRTTQMACNTAPL